MSEHTKTSNECTTIKKDTVSRLIKDIKEAMILSKEKNNIFYKHDTENMLVGYALIIGCEDTPYQYGNYLFKLTFPTNYPFSPPKVKFLSNDGITRFHPNFYRNGTCCLSILNTWKGEQWTACQSISSVLLTISSLFQNNPLLLEPGITLAHRDVKKYTEIIQYRNLCFSVFEITNLIINRPNESSTSSISNDLLFVAKLFEDEISDMYILNKSNIFDVCNKLVKTMNYLAATSIYNMKVHINYKLIYDKLETYL